MGNRDVLEPDEARPRDERGKEPPPRRRLATHLFRFVLRMVGVIALGFRIIRWLADVLGL